MSFHRFMTFDPYLSFAESERGFAERVFLKEDGTPTETWYGKQRDGKGYLSPLWRIGRDAYATVATKIGEQPRAKQFYDIAETIKQFEKEAAKEVQPLIDEGVLSLHEYRDSAPIDLIESVVEDAPDGWLLEIYTQMARRCIVSGQLPEKALPDLELLLSGAAVLYLDDYIIAAQLGHEVETAFEIITSNIASAKLYRETIDAASVAISSNGRRSAKVRHRSSNERRHKAIEAWEAALTGSAQRGLKPPTMIGFARKNHGEYFVTQETVCDWVREHEKAKK